MANHLITSCTKGKQEDTLLYKCNQLRNKQFHCDIIEYNTEGLSKKYNEIIEKYKNRGYDYIHFVHDDVFIYDDIDIIDYIVNEYKFDIFGVAGSSRSTVKPPYLWHLMSDKRCSLGSVEHGKVTESYLSTFGANYGNCVIMDGVYMGINLKTIGEWRFNENFDFHFYDIASSIDAFKKGLKLGIIPIHIRHEAKLYNPLENECWQKNAKKFEELYVRK